MKVSIIIPAFNEEKTISKIIKLVKESNTINFKKEIIVVDDGSTDKTREKIKKIKGIKKIFHDKNKGKGSAILTGINYATGELILIQDADLEYPPENYERLLKPFSNDKIQVVYGTRFKGKMPKKIILHTFGNLVLSIATTVIFFKWISDMETGYKVFRKKVIQNLDLKAKGFDFEPEVTGKLLKKNLNIVEIPIIFNPRSFEEGKKITWKDGIKALKTLIKVRFSND